MISTLLNKNINKKIKFYNHHKCKRHKLQISLAKKELAHTFQFYCNKITKQFSMLEISHTIHQIKIQLKDHLKKISN